MNRIKFRGFASMDPARRRLVSRQGALAAHALGVAHRWTSEEARAAGRKGGQKGGRVNSPAQVAQRAAALRHRRKPDAENDV